jgi:hypothetical protein
MPTDNSERQLSRRRAIKAAAGIATLAAPVAALAGGTPADPIVPLVAEWLARMARERVEITDGTSDEDVTAFFRPIFDLEDRIKSTAAISAAGVLAKLAVGLAMARIEANGDPDDPTIDPSKMTGLEVYEEFFINAALDAERMGGVS